jgi:hypothetical protein
MPADMPPTPVVVAMPYARVIAFVVGGGVTFAVLLLITNLIGQLPPR